MNTKSKIINIFQKYYPIIAIAFFAIVTLIVMFLRTPFWDEAHQVDIARLSVVEILKITRVIGHPFLWYLIIKPFSSPNLYPYSIYIINWTFCLCAITVLWKRSPFNLLIKTLITFSVPFLFFFAPVARCYSLGVFLLFLLCSLYRVKCRYPYIYAFLIIICANTSAMALIGSFYLGFLLLYELHKRKHKELKKIFTLFVLCAIFILAQVAGVEKPYAISTGEFIFKIFSFVIIPSGPNIQAILLHVFSSVMFYTFPFYCYKKSKKALFFISGTFITLSLIFIFEYYGSYWNHYFYYIYFIMTFWIFYKKIYSKIIRTLFCLILLMFCSNNAIFYDVADLPYISHSKEIANQILKNPQYKNSKLFVLEGWNDISPGADIFLARENVYLYDIRGRKKISYESLKDIYYLNDELIDFDKLYELMGTNAYIAANTDIRNYNYSKVFINKQGNDYILKTFNNTYLIKNIESKPEIGFFVYKPIKITSYGKINLWK